jgi:hypothetical protein
MVELLTSVLAIAELEVPIQVWTRFRYVGFPNKTRSG